MQTDSSLDRLQQLLPELFNPKPRQGELFLKFELGPNLTAAIALEHVFEILRVSGNRITPIPQMLPPILGLMNTKGKVFWAIDLAQRLGLHQPAYPDRYYEMIVVQLSSVEALTTLPEDLRANPDLPLLGLCVPRIRGTLRLAPEAIQSPIDQVNPAIRPYLRGCAPEGPETILILSVEAIC
jgi:positive phototaxis protein PixI